MPLSQPCGCSPPRMPNFFASKIISAAPAGRGAYVSTLGIIFWANGTGSLMRFDTVANVQLADLLVNVAFSLRSVAYNPVDGFLYSYDQNAGSYEKIDKLTGAAINIAVSAGGGNDMIYSPSGTAIFASGGGVEIDRINIAGVVAPSVGVTPQGVGGLAYSTINGQIVVGLTSGVAVVDPVALTVVKSNNGIVYRPVSYGPNSGLILAGRNVAGANGVIAFDPVAPAFAALSVPPAGKFQSGGYSALTGLHYMIETATGVCWFIADTLAFGDVVGQYAIGIPTLFCNDSFPVETGNAVYVPAGGSLIVNIFK